MASLRAAFLLCLVAGASLASSAVQLDVPSLTRAASDVLRIRVISTRCVWTDEHRRIVTLVEVEVLESWKGSAKGTLTVVQPGGELDGIGQRVTGVAPLALREEAVLFLEPEGQLRRVVGLAQGVYRVERSAGATQATPARASGLSLVSATGSPLQPRKSVSLETLRDGVRREVARE